ncbi:MAG: flagellar M-ring protein FliF [Lachnospiraceae bacterium]|nr:flagellar M-ring protein FliF [Lachnospiraceae bacterium]
MEKLMEIRDKILAWWNKYTTKQKTVIVGIFAVAVFTIAILAYVFSRPTYVAIKTCENQAETSEAKAALESAGVAVVVGKDALTISVEEKDEITARLALASAGFSATEPDLGDYLSGSLSTTESDKQKYYAEFWADKLEANFSNYENVKRATVELNLPKEDGTLIRKEEEASAYICLELEGSFSQDNAAAMAKATAAALGNTDTSNIVIVDTKANVLFAGEDDYTTAGQASNFMELNTQAENYIKYKIANALLMTGQFDMVEAAPHLNFDFSSYEQTNHSYDAQNGREEGYKSHESVTSGEDSSGVGGVPGTDSNDGTSYLYQDGSETSSSYETRDTDYVLDEEILSKVTPAGVIDYNTSSISVTAITYNRIYEELAESQGLLEGITWEQYKLLNDTSTKIEVDEEFYSVVATATGMDPENITIMAFRENLFIDEETEDINWSDITSIVLIVIILALLAFMILRSMSRNKEEVEVEDELSVEKLLQSTQENTVDDIEVETKSETRKMIEKFVDENPEAAASLLRNWLNDDWR